MKKSKSIFLILLLFAVVLLSGCSIFNPNYEDEKIAASIMKDLSNMFTPVPLTVEEELKCIEESRIIGIDSLGRYAMLYRILGEEGLNSFIMYEVPYITEIEYHPYAKEILEELGAAQIYITEEDGFYTEIDTSLGFEILYVYMIPKKVHEEALLLIYDEEFRNEHPFGNELLEDADWMKENIDSHDFLFYLEEEILEKNYGIDSSEIPSIYVFPN